MFLLAVSREHGFTVPEGDRRSNPIRGRAGRGASPAVGVRRDVYRLVDPGAVDEYGLLERLLREQCHVGRHRDGRPGADDDASVRSLAADTAIRVSGRGAPEPTPFR